MSFAEKLVVDASVAVKWYVPEPGSAKASIVLQRGARLLAPDLLFSEFGNILWKKVRRGELSTDEASTILDSFVTACPVSLHPSGFYIRGAFDIATGFGQTVYDSLYVAIAVAEGCGLITADEKLARAFQGSALGAFVQALDGPP